MSTVELDVGGKIYKTTVSTLTSFPDSYFTTLFNGNWKNQEDGNGRIFIDRDWETFRYVLEFLRNRDQSVMPINDEFLVEQIRLEAQFFLLPQLAEFLERNDPKTLAMHSNRRVELVWCSESDLAGTGGLASLSLTLNKMVERDMYGKFTILSMAQLSSVPNSYFWSLAKNIINKTLDLDKYGAFEYRDGRYYIPFSDHTDWQLARSVCRIMIGHEVDYEPLTIKYANETIARAERYGGRELRVPKCLDLLSRFVKMAESMKVPKAVDHGRKLCNAINNRTQLLE